MSNFTATLPALLNSTTLAVPQTKMSMQNVILINNSRTSWPTKIQMSFYLAQEKLFAGGTQHIQYMLHFGKDFPLVSCQTFN